MYKALSYLKPYRIAIVIAILLTLVELFVELFHPLLMAKIIDDGILKGDLSVVLMWGGVMVGISFLAFTAGVLNSFFSAHVSQSFGYDIRKALFEKVQAFSFTNFNIFPTSSLITRMTNDVTQLQNSIFMALRIMLRAPLLVIGGVIMALLVNVKLALILVLTIPFLISFLIWVMRKGGTLFQAVQAKLDGVNRVMQENLSGMRLIKAFLRRKHEGKRFTKANEELKDRTVLALRVIEVAMPVLLLVMNISILAVLWFGSFDVSEGDATVGEIVAIINYAMRITAAFSVFAFIIMGFSRAKASSQRVSEVLDTEIDLVDTVEMNTSSRILDGKIQFDNVSFHYPGTESPVLKRITFTAKPGQTVAILGATGSGKSSLFQLIPRLYDVSEGTISIDQINIRTIKLETLRMQMGYVPQEVLLFTGTVKENISWGKENASMEEIIEAAKSAQIHETIDKLPNKYETIVGQRGVNLSGGQKQRISIARALIRKPKILLLDDSTSALDLNTEAKLLKSLKEYECTTLIITQKISTAMEADNILLLEDGMVLEEGKHEYLLKHSSLYQQIYKSQFGEES
jgi:ATP-binding cassette subfamily B multidrug efflux pump